MNSNSAIRFTTSWDDGHPFDTRLAELLDRRGFKGTFYVPVTNQEGLPVLDATSLRLIDQAVEIGSHTMDHCYLTTVDDAAARQQVVDGKQRLEDLLGHAVDGFCYPGGKFGPRDVATVRSAGFRYARTTANLHTTQGESRFLMPTTHQFYPHSASVYVRNWLRHGKWQKRATLLHSAVQHGALLPRLKAALDNVCSQGEGVFHLWGHSWEFDLFDGWRLLDEFLEYAAERVPPLARVSNADLLVSRPPSTRDSQPGRLATQY